MKGQRIDVLDHGFVELVDFMGDDQRVVDAARTSVSGDQVKPVSTNEALIRYLMRNHHDTPYEMPTMTFAVRLPIFVARQWMRHRNSYNEMSARYSVLPDNFYIPEVSRLNVQAKNNHQGSDPDVIDDAEFVRSQIKKHSELSYELYQSLLDKGLARELARVVLPTNIYTQFYWTVNLRSLLHFLYLRKEGHAQYEIRCYADAIDSLVRPIFPQCFKAFDDYRVNSRSFSQDEVTILSELLQQLGVTEEDIHKAALNRSLSKRELREFVAALGLASK